LWVSIRDRATTRVTAGDPWDGRALEWSTSAPPPEYNFAVPPVVTRRDDFYESKRDASPYLAPLHYDPIEVPRGSALGPAIGLAAAACCFGLVWHMWWLAGLGLVGAIAALIARSFVRDTHRVIPAAEVERTERRWLTMVHDQPPVDRRRERTPANRGVALVVPQ